MIEIKVGDLVQITTELYATMFIDDILVYQPSIYAKKHSAWPPYIPNNMPGVIQQSKLGIIVNTFENVRNLFKVMTVDNDVCAIYCANFKIVRGINDAV